MPSCWLCYARLFPERQCHPLRTTSFPDLKDYLIVSCALHSGGWTVGAEGKETSHGLIHVLERKDQEVYSFYVCNTGEGLEYHPTIGSGDPPAVQYKCVLAFHDVARRRIEDSSFWWLLFKTQIWGTPEQSAATVYTTLLPYLNNRTLTGDLDIERKDPQPVTEYKARSNSPWRCALEALHCMCRRAGLTFSQSKFVSVLVRWSALRMVQDDLRFVPTVTGSEVIVCPSHWLILARPLVVSLRDCVLCFHFPLAVTVLMYGLALMVQDIF